MTYSKTFDQDSVNHQQDNGSTSPFAGLTAEVWVVWQLYFNHLTIILKSTFVFSIKITYMLNRVILFHFVWFSGVFIESFSHNKLHTKWILKEGYFSKLSLFHLHVIFSARFCPFRENLDSFAWSGMRDILNEFRFIVAYFFVFIWVYCFFFRMKFS